MKHQAIEALAERPFARSNSRLSCDQPEPQKDLKMAAGLILLLAKSPDHEIDVPPSDYLQDACGFGRVARES
jgi:hypothetical protein